MDDLFGEIPQPERARTAESKNPLTPEDVRAMMRALIEALSGVDDIPFTPLEFEKHIAMFPIMAQWLPADEGNQLVFAFMREVERLKKAA